MLNTLDRERGYFVASHQVLPSLTANDLTSDGVPEGFDTIAHWWATEEAEALDLLRDPLATFYADTEALQTFCEERGLPFQWVPACKSFRAVGLDKQRAFPMGLIAAFYPANP